MKNLKTIIKNEVNYLNPTTSEVSSLGCYVSASAQMVSDAVYSKVVEALTNDSLAYKIVTDKSMDEQFTEKQLWAVTFELLKNDDYVKKIVSENEAFEKKEEFKRARRKAKKSEAKKIKTDLANKISTIENNNNDLLLNQKVSHAKFGEGVVTGMDNETITVNFEEVGDKKMIKRFAKLETK